MDVDPFTLTIRSESNHLASRLAYALAITTSGALLASPEGPAITPEALTCQIGDFDLAIMNATSRPLNGTDYRVRYYLPPRILRSSLFDESAADGIGLSSVSS